MTTKSNADDEFKGRLLITVRHGERMDLAFGDWVKMCFDKQGRYKPQDLNHPRNLIQRDPKLHQNDSPLTPIGEFQGVLFGQGLHDNRIDIKHVYASSAIRCVQTCHNILKGAKLADKLSINVEPGLFEYLGDHLHRLPTWLTPKELASTGIPVNLDYQPVINASDMLLSHVNENHKGFYERCFKVIDRILSSTSSGNTLIVAHAASLDSCPRLLTGKPIPDWNEFNNFVYQIPYLSHSVAYQTRKGIWKMIDPLFPGITITANQSYDYKRLFSLLPK